MNMVHMTKRSCALLLSSALALTATITTVPNMTAEASTVDTQQVTQLDQYAGLDQYIHLTEDDTVMFDTQQAELEGYDRAAIAAVQSNVDIMNTLLRQGAYWSNSDKTVILSGISARVRGVTKIEQTWDGQTRVYLNSSDTKQFISTWEKTLPVTSKACDVAGIVPKYGNVVQAIVCTFTGIHQLRLSQAKVAASKGNGIVIRITRDPIYNTEGISFSAQ